MTVQTRDCANCMVSRDCANCMVSRDCGGCMVSRDCGGCIVSRDSWCFVKVKQQSSLQQGCLVLSDHLCDSVKDRQIICVTM